jgi:hypothetical protein
MSKRSDENFEDFKSRKDRWGPAFGTLSVVVVVIAVILRLFGV